MNRVLYYHICTLYIQNIYIYIKSHLKLWNLFKIETCLEKMKESWCTRSHAHTLVTYAQERGDVACVSERVCACGRRLSGVVWAVRGERSRWRRLQHTESLTCCPSPPLSRPGSLSPALIRLRETNTVTHTVTVTSSLTQPATKYRNHARKEALRTVTDWRLPRQLRLMPEARPDRLHFRGQAGGGGGGMLWIDTLLLCNVTS